MIDVTYRTKTDTITERHNDDADYTLRASALGWTVLNVKQATVITQTFMSKIKYKTIAGAHKAGVKAGNFKETYKLPSGLYCYIIEVDISKT